MSDKLKNLILDMEESKEYDIPRDHIVSCIDCEWRGHLRDCKQEEEQDGWEYPLYTIHLCPKCEGLVEI